MFKLLLETDIINLGNLFADIDIIKETIIRY